MIGCILKAFVHHCVEVVVCFATGCHHLVVASLGEDKDKRTDDDYCHLVMTCPGQQKKRNFKISTSPRDYCVTGFSRELRAYDPDRSQTDPKTKLKYVI